MAEDKMALSMASLSLSSGDTVADAQARKAILIHLVTGNALSINEIRLLKQLLSPVTLQKDILPNLPTELVIMVIDHLDEEDILACLGVSRNWNAMLLNNKIVFDLADRFFPQLTWGRSLNIASDPTTQKTLRLQFIQHLQNRLDGRDPAAHDPGDFMTGLERPYCFETEWDFKLRDQDYDDFPRPSGPPSGEATLYAHGRIAWQAGRHMLVLDNFLDNSRQIFLFPSQMLGDKINPEALGDKLVVAAMGRHIFACDIQTQTFAHKTLPAHSVQCTTHGNQVAIMTEQNLYVWTVGDTMTEIPLVVYEVEYLGVRHYPKAFFHPRLENVVYVRRAHRHASSNVRFVIDKFVDRKHTETFHHDMAIGWLKQEQTVSAHDGFIPLVEQSQTGDDVSFLHEFDTFHESFTRRKIPPGWPKYSDSAMFFFDDDFNVETRAQGYILW